MCDCLYKILFFSSRVFNNPNCLNVSIHFSSFVIKFPNDVKSILLGFSFSIICFFLSAGTWSIEYTFYTPTGVRENMKSAQWVDNLWSLSSRIKQVVTRKKEKEKWSEYSLTPACLIQWQIAKYNLQFGYRSSVNQISSSSSFFSSVVCWI